jgi:Cu2+-exporting ATPase
LGNAGFCGLDNDGDGDRSRVLLACDGYLLASFEFEDRLRDDALPTVRRLQAAKATVCILSGDRGRSVALVADELGGIASVSGLAPEEKARAVVALRQSGGVAMVGDGINDVVALRAADVSFAPSAAADIGRAAADFILTNDKLEGVPFALWLARKADTLVRQNLVLSIAYNMVFLPLAASGMLTPSIAAIAMSSSSFVVVLNALRLRVARAPSTGTTS